MKIRYQNGFSISLWSNEFKEIEITEEVVKYLTQDDQWVRIKVPSQWLQNSSSSSSEPPSPPANELGRESNNTVGASVTPPSDMIKILQRRIEGLKMMWDVKVAELAREVRSIPEVNLKELETKVLDRIEAVRKEHDNLLQTDFDNINGLREESCQFKDDFKEIHNKLNTVCEVINVIINYDPALKNKIKASVPSIK